MRNADKVEIKVGLFVLIGVALFIISVFAISGDQSVFTQYYTIKVRFPHVTGLGQGSVVQVLGVPVGNVEKIEFGKDHNDLITFLNIDTKYESLISNDSVAEVQTKGALGDKFIYILPGSSKIPLKHDSFINANKKDDFLTTLNSKGEDVNEAFMIIHDIRKILHDLNGNGEVKEIVSNLQALTQNMKKITNDGVLDKELKISIQSLANVLQKVDQGKGTLGALINDPSIHHSLKRMLGAKSYNHSLKKVIRTSIKESEN